MPRRISRGVKDRIPIMHYEHKLSVVKICEYLGVKKTMVYRALAYHRAFGLPYDPCASSSGRHSILSSSDKQYIERTVTRDGAVYLDELQQMLSERRSISISIPSLWRALHGLHITHKLVSKRAIERNAMVRAAFKNFIGLLAPNPEMLIFLDESVRDSRTNSRRFGWSLKGTRICQRQVFVRGARISILPALTLDGIIAYDLIEGPVTAERFHQFLRDMVVCICQSWQGINMSNIA